MSPAETAEPIQMLFGLRNGVGVRNHVLDGDQHPPMGRGNFEGESVAHCKVWGRSSVSCAKTAEMIEVPFGLRI